MYTFARRGHRRLAVIPVLLIAACGTYRAIQPLNQPDGSQLVTAEQIKRSGATNAWETLKRTVTGLNFREDRHGNPSRIGHRGASSILLRDHPSVFVDGIRLTDFTHLHLVPAADIARIRFMSGINATTRYGTNSGDGAILIYTKTGLSS